ncbi:putative voltage-gated potassium channel subunit beta [Diplonema papillatum]|nr:putative voltage-gated potassium channel subunit beta [Diplonema papillatum]
MQCIADRRAARLPGVSKPVTRVVFGTLFLHVTPDAFDLLDEAWDFGIRTFDCAAIYGRGECETILGAWIAQRGYGSEAVVITKGGCLGQGDLWSPCLDDVSIRRDLEGSLSRLQLQKVDVYMLHRDDPSMPVDDIVDSMNLLLKEGLFDSWGVSNWTPSRLEAARVYARCKRLALPNCNSIQVSLASPKHEVWPGTLYMRSSDLEYYCSSGVPVLGWECLAKGFLAGCWDIASMSRRPASTKLSDENAACWRNWQLAKAYITDDNLGRLSRTRQLADELKCTPAVVALAWVLSQPYNAFALVGTTKKEHLQQAGQASALHLTDDQCLWLQTGRFPDSD